MVAWCLCSKFMPFYCVINLSLFVHMFVAMEFESFKPGVALMAPHSMLNVADATSSTEQPQEQIYETSLEDIANKQPNDLETSSSHLTQNDYEPIKPITELINNIPENDSIKIVESASDSISPDQPNNINNAASGLIEVDEKVESRPSIEKVIPLNNNMENPNIDKSLLARRNSKNDDLSNTSTADGYTNDNNDNDDDADADDDDKDDKFNNWKSVDEVESDIKKHNNNTNSNDISNDGQIIPINTAMTDNISPYQNNPINTNDSKDKVNYTNSENSQANIISKTGLLTLLKSIPSEYNEHLEAKYALRSTGPLQSNLMNRGFKRPTMRVEEFVRSKQEKKNDFENTNNISPEVSYINLDRDVVGKFGRAGLATMQNIMDPTQGSNPALIARPLPPTSGTNLPRDSAGNCFHCINVWLLIALSLLYTHIILFPILN